jgi:RHS repeat-associated protein
VGHLASATDRLGRRIDYRYDAVGRESGETWVAANGSTDNLLTFTYDGVGNQLTAADYDGTYTLTFDARRSVSTVVDLWGNRLTFTYDAAGNRTVVADSKGGTTTSTFDALNRVSTRKFTDGVTPLRVDVAYTAIGQVGTITRFSNLSGTVTVATSAYTYDAAGRITNLHTTDGASANLANYTYTYDAADRPTTETRNGAAPTSYVYDNASQLTADGNSTVTYDGTGNRNNGSYTVGTNNRLTNDGTWTYTYDAESNLSKKSKGASAETWTYGYDEKNHLLWAEDRATDGGTLLKRVDYKYDAYGDRVQKALDSNGDGVVDTTERYAYDGWNPAKPSPVGTENFDVWLDEDGSNNLVTRYLRGDVVDEVWARIGSDTNAHWYAPDRQGSIRDVLDNSGVIKDTITYSGFGEILNDTNATFRGRYAWTGREMDTETGFQFNRARYYDPRTGKWTSQDPLGFDAGDSNIYRYAKNRFNAETDSSGLVPLLGWFSYDSNEELSRSAINRQIGINGRVHAVPGTDALILDSDDRNSESAENAIAIWYVGSNAAKVDFVQFLSASRLVIRQGRPNFFDRRPLEAPFLGSPWSATKLSNQLQYANSGIDSDMWNVDSYMRPVVIPFGLYTTVALPLDPHYLRPGIGGRGMGMAMSNAVVMIDAPGNFYSYECLQHYAAQDSKSYDSRVTKVILTEVFDTYVVVGQRAFFHVIWSQTGEAHLLKAGKLADMEVDGSQSRPVVIRMEPVSGISTFEQMALSRRGAFSMN